MSISRNIPPLYFRKICFLLIMVLLFLIVGCSSKVDSRGYPTKEIFDNFYSQYSEVFSKIDGFYTSTQKNYALVKSQKMSVYEFKSTFDKSEKELKSAIVSLNSIAIPRGINAQYSIDYLKFSAECGIEAIHQFKDISIFSFESNIQKGENAKDASMKYVQDIMRKVYQPTK